LACGLRRGEVAALKLDDIQRREDHWAVVDLTGKAGMFGPCLFLIGSREQSVSGSPQPAYKDGERVFLSIKKNPWWSVWVDACKLEKAFLIEFGLTPASRRNVKITPP
jgi:integrase